MIDNFTDLLTANATFAESFDLAGTPGVAGAGVTIVTCMDSRIDPLKILGLSTGDAKVLRNPGGQVTEEVMQGLILAVHLLSTDRIMVVPHTRCAMGSASETEFRQKVATSSGQDVAWQHFMAVDDQTERLRADVEAVRTHPLIAGRATVGGFRYDVDTGLIQQHY